ncbi:hypothetical protein [Nocardia anaemiae]|uniref:hypothetical protein n=1 Tax=Nocardia anaemiae TaxID=263910 RepID=UPI0007A493E0|nr:hypothetical protein [Nocardia anaemiae]
MQDKAETSAALVARGSATDRKAAADALWNPSLIGDDVWRQIGVDPSTLSSDIGGIDRIDGFRRCGGHDNPRTYSIDVWSQVYTVDDFTRKEAGVEFVPVRIADRRGLRYRPASDRAGDHCNLIFASILGSFSIEVLRLEPRSRVASDDRAIEVANAVVPLLPR